jgi:hypothetical protein
MVMESIVSSFQVSTWFLDLTCYTDLAGANILKFGIESKRSCLTTSTQAFKKALVQSLQELRVMCEEGCFELMPRTTGGEQVQARL